MKLLLATSALLLRNTRSFLYAPIASVSTLSSIPTLDSKASLQVRESSPFTTYRSMSSSDEVQKAKEAAASYQASSLDEAGPDTVFDKVLSGEWSSNKVYEDELVYAFTDISPQAPVHILVIPKKRDGLTKLSHATESQKDILGHLMFVAQKVGKENCPNGFRVVINDGEEGAQSVYHLHLHVLGGRQMNWPPG